MKAHELLSDESKWCKYALAKDANGVSVDVHSTRAVSFCAAGAIFRCYAVYHSILNILTKHLESCGYDNGIVRWNNEKNHKTIYETLKRLDI